MANIANAGGKFVAEVGNLFKAIGGTFKDEGTRKALAEGIKKVDFKDVGKTPGRGIIGNVIGWTTWMPRKFGQATINTASRAVNGLAKFYPEHRILTTVGTVGAAAGGAYLMAEGKHNKMEAAAREGAMEQISMMQSMQPQVSYKDVTSPADYRAMEERLGAGNGVSMGDKVLDARAAQAANTPAAG